MTSIASSRRHRSSATDPAYFFLLHSAARPPTFMSARLVPDHWPGPAVKLTRATGLGSSLRP
jgi:hypothetical protein